MFVLNFFFASLLITSVFFSTLNLTPQASLITIREKIKLTINKALTPCSKNIENVPGCVAFLTSLFAENGVNITECLSCWTDTLFVIHADDVSRAIGFLTL